MAAKRLLREHQNMLESPSPYFTCGPAGSDLFTWFAEIKGPEGTPYEGGRFLFSLTFPPDYPFKDPAMKCLTKVYHPNIDWKTGFVCVRPFSEGHNWLSVGLLGVYKACLALHALLAAPFPDNALMDDLALEYLCDPEVFCSNARAWTNLYAMS